MTEQQIGSALDALGVTADLDDDDMVADALVILKVVQDDGSIALSIGTTDSRDWISQAGLLHAALEVTQSGYTRDRDD
ncbi:hypothetical protein [Streptomyces lavendofoliae]|uniref:Uncharacterized protein n=1 Tax=Streptomyces lavendofoliae TaxID=67314 RepID=A0A918I5A9_9ACTN|nr:hypothetical protein [Streptomyces lavendofoliae]GGU62798.1 hypothetical protein GCM10010274_59540 [Streptomyces lavendofoliae]